MSEQIGKMITCDRCGKTVFLKYTGTTSLSEDYGKVDNFEKRPEGWEYHTNKELGLLCPECEGAYRRVVRKFKQDILKE